jgi:hypothetical protein
VAPVWSWAVTGGHQSLVNSPMLETRRECTGIPQGKCQTDRLHAKQKRGKFVNAFTKLLRVETKFQIEFPVYK